MVGAKIGRGQATRISFDQDLGRSRIVDLDDPGIDLRC